MSLAGKSILFDTDMGPDDAWALIMLLKASLLLKFNVIGITCVHGNADLDNVTRNTIRVLETINRTDIPVYKGAKHPLVNDRYVLDPFFGIDGFGDVQFDNEPNMTVVQTENAISALHRLTVKENRNITIIAVGPLTNIALAIRTYPNFIDKVDDIYIMGGNYKGEGNRESAEYNFHQDPEAAFVVLNAIKNPAYILPWETIIPPKLNVTPDWRFNVLGSIDNKITQLLNPTEHAYHHTTPWTPADIGAVAAFIYPKVVKNSDERCASIELNGQLTRGQMVMNYSTKCTKTNTVIIEELNEEIFKNLILWAAGHDTVSDQMAFGL